MSKLVSVTLRVSDDTDDDDIVIALRDLELTESPDLDDDPPMIFDVLDIIAIKED